MAKDKHPTNDDTLRGEPMDTGRAPARIGQYVIKREIARGGMGVVFEAVQDEPRRTVAVKVMKDSLASDEALRRFRYEAQLLARLRHPGIAQVYEAGTHDGTAGAVPFFAMEYIPNAKPITEYAEWKKLSADARLELFARVCDAVHHGHQRGIVHRDLKPGNILVDSSGNPRIIDFGVARATDSDMATIQTEVGQIIGSLNYMSPEQFEADPNDIDTRSDVYALGVVLYELMRGELPYDLSNTTIIEAARIVRDYTPPKLSRDDPSLRGDVETIALKALEKDRDRRYQSAHGLAADVRRYLNKQPIEARPPSLAYQLRMFTRRHRALIGSMCVVFVALTVAVVVSTTSWIKADRERERAEAQTERARAAVQFLESMVSSAIPPAYGADISLRTVLDEAARGVTAAFPNDPESEADIHSMIAEGYVNLNSWSESERHYRTALEINRRVHGPTHRKTIESLWHLISLYEYTGQLDEREALLREAINAETVVYGPEHEETVGAIEKLALVLTQNNKLDEAGVLASKVLAIRVRELGQENEHTLATQVLLALIELWRGDNESSERMSRAAYETSIRVLGADHATTRSARSQLGAVFLATGRIDESQALYGRKAAPADLGVVQSFQGASGSPLEGAVVYVFWESW